MNVQKCHNCGSNLSASGLDRRLAIIHCFHCGAIFDLTKKRADECVKPDNHYRDHIWKYKIEPRPFAAMPEGFNVENSNGKLAVSWKWTDQELYEESRFIKIAFLAIYIAILFIFDIINPVTISFFIFSFIYFFFYLDDRMCGVAVTKVELNSSQLMVKHAPLRWFSSFSVRIFPFIFSDKWKDDFIMSSKNIEQFYAKINESNYELYLISRNNEQKIIVGNLKTIEQALYLEQEFERFLNIRDRRVAGEIG